MSQHAGTTKNSSNGGSHARRWSKADFDERRTLIVDAALALLHRHGAKGVTMRRVAARLGVGAMTLYTYVKGQEELHRSMVRHGFEMLHGCCRASAADRDLSQPLGWRAGAKAYVNFGLEHPNLYRLMFDTPISEQNLDLLQGGFQPLLDRVIDQLASRSGLTGDALSSQARAAAGRYWIALHGLTTLAIAGRLTVLEGTLDQILDDLLLRVAPVVRC